ncbi:unnamed protein product [Mytilus coruscus]|uniref:Uncharacterized protein n=1 Tax=Mytilus coruscus TaxID=42192 RepID=A0A6J8B0G4_MYTCO|nr:unnamed protein product [Mytilus coruscus]
MSTVTNKILKFCLLYQCVFILHDWDGWVLYSVGLGDTSHDVNCNQETPDLKCQVCLSVLYQCVFILHDWDGVGVIQCRTGDTSHDVNCNQETPDINVRYVYCISMYSYYMTGMEWVLYSAGLGDTSHDVYCNQRYPDIKVRYVYCISMYSYYMTGMEWVLYSVGLGIHVMMSTVTKRHQILMSGMSIVSVFIFILHDWDGVGVIQCRTRGYMS